MNLTSCLVIVIVGIGVVVYLMMAVRTGIDIYKGRFQKEILKENMLGHGEVVPNNLPDAVIGGIFWITLVIPYRGENGGEK